MVRCRSWCNASHEQAGRSLSSLHFVAGPQSCTTQYPTRKYVVHLIALSQDSCERGSVMKTLASSLLVALLTLGSNVGCSRPSSRLTHTLNAAKNSLDQPGHDVRLGNNIDSSTGKPSPCIKWPVASGRQRKEARKAINNPIPPRAANGRVKGL
jgi:hypothetical protein